MARIRARWVFTAAAIALAGIWIWGARFEAEFRRTFNSPLIVRLRYGALRAEYFRDWIPISRSQDNLSLAGLLYQQQRWHFEFFGVQLSGLEHPKHPIIFNLPLWIPTIPLAAIAVGMWRADARRTRLGHCPTCDYDRHGLDPVSKCPECGAGSGGRG